MFWTRSRRARTEPIIETVHDAIGGRPRLNWSPVTDGGGRAATDSADERSSFHFDLGGALARLGDQPRRIAWRHRGRRSRRRPRHRPPVAAPATAPAPPRPHPPRCIAPPTPPPRRPPPPTVEQPLPQRAPPRSQLPRPLRPPLEPLPRRGERPAPEAPVAPRPVTPREPARDRTSPPDAPCSTTPRRPPARRCRRRPRAPSAPIVPPPAGSGQVAHLPASRRCRPARGRRRCCRRCRPPPPHVSPMYTPPIESAPSTPDINAFRSAQLQRKPPAAPRQDVQPHDARPVPDRRPRRGGAGVRPPISVPDRVGPVADPDRRRDPERARRRVRSHRRPRRSSRRPTTH